MIEFYLGSNISDDQVNNQFEVGTFPFVFSESTYSNEPHKLYIGRCRLTPTYSSGLGYDKYNNELKIELHDTYNNPLSTYYGGLSLNFGTGLKTQHEDQTAMLVVDYDNSQFNYSSDGLQLNFENLIYKLRENPEFEYAIAQLIERSQYIQDVIKRIQ